MWLIASVRSASLKQWRWMPSPAYLGSNFDAQDVRWSSHVKGTKLMPLIAVLHNKQEEVVITDEGFQVMQFSEDFKANLSFHVREPVPAEELFITLTNPETGAVYRMQMKNTKLDPGDEVTIHMALIEALNESPKH